MFLHKKKSYNSFILVKIYFRNNKTFLKRLSFNLSRTVLLHTEDSRTKT